MRRYGVWIVPLALIASGCATSGRSTPAELAPEGHFARFWGGEHRGTEDLESSGFDFETDIEFPALHDPPLARYGVPTDRHDPFLFPALTNLVEENPRFDDDSPEEDLRQRISRRRQFSIRFPGADTSNFPNSAYTLPKGRAYVENSPLMLTGPSSGLPLSYNWEFLLRYGLTDNLELRLFSNGPTVITGEHGTTGFAPLAFDMKVHLWGENLRYFLPAAGLEVYLQTPFGSPELSAGTQPSITLLFDKELPRDWSVGLNVGVTGNQTPLVVDESRSEEIFYVVATQWAVQKRLTPDLALFYQGYVNSSNLPRIGNLQREEDDFSIVQGLGATYILNDRVSAFGSYNLGAGRGAPDYYVQLGFAVAF